MVDSAASIKSLYSGVGVFSDGEDDHSFASGSQGVSGGTDLGSTAPTHLRATNAAVMPAPSAISQARSPALLQTQKSITEDPPATSLVKGGRPIAVLQGAGAFENPAWHDRSDNSTNISLASEGSDYQQVIGSLENAYGLDVEQLELSASEDISRPQSRNSTTSCLSTTATKDGVEGKRIHRHIAKQLKGPLAQSQKLYQHSPLSPHVNTVLEDQTVGQDEPSEGLRSDFDKGNLPPISLNEKIRLMNFETL